MPNDFKSNVETGFVIVLGIVVFSGFCWLTHRYALISITILTLCPIVSYWLWKFYQEKISTDTVKAIFQSSFVILFICFLLMMVDYSRFETTLDSFFLEGKRVSKMVEQEADEGPNTFMARRYTFILQDSKDEWKMNLVQWYMGLIVFAFPILTLKLLSKIKPVYNEEEEQRKRRSERFWSSKYK